jgi:MFS family permease
MNSTGRLSLRLPALAAVFMVSLDATVVVAAFPALRGNFAAATPAELSWVLNGYTIVYAALLVPAGQLAKQHGTPLDCGARWGPARRVGRGDGRRRLWF